MKQESIHGSIYGGMLVIAGCAILACSLKGCGAVGVIQRTKLQQRDVLENMLGKDTPPQ